MNLENLWRDIGREQETAGSAGLVLRRVDPGFSDDLFIGVRVSAGTRVVLLRMPLRSEPARTALVQSRGFVTHLTRFEHEPQDSCDLVLEATDRTFNPIFGVLTEDLVGRVVNRGSHPSAASVFLGALQQWKHFFDAAGTEGLSAEQQLGLFAELSFLEGYALVHIRDAAAAVTGWVGPDPLAKDFQYPSCAVEVKATASREPSKVRINGERQLDTDGVPRLFLLVVFVERAVTGGRSLPEIVDRVRELVRETAARFTLEEKLLASGYHDVHRMKYEASRYIVHSSRIFEVRSGFPRLTSGLPPGVGDLSYTVTLSACVPFGVDPSALAGLLSST